MTGILSESYMNLYGFDRDELNNQKVSVQLEKDQEKQKDELITDSESIVQQNNIKQEDVRSLARTMFILTKEKIPFSNLLYLCDEAAKELNEATLEDIPQDIRKECAEAMKITNDVFRCNAIKRVLLKREKTIYSGGYDLYGAKTTKYKESVEDTKIFTKDEKGSFFNLVRNSIKIDETKKKFDKELEEEYLDITRW
ncbi:MAG: hypothetical protein K0R98_1569 [Rickettsiaceae bacterium]|jgi:hypothetical protein|nr:hypothetical protein [Rickettsiaceae bacterium]